VPELSPDAFRKLLAELDADPERAGEKYEALRHRLVVFFEGRFCGYESEGLADRTLDVLAGKLLEGLELYSYSGLSGYAFGVARNLLRDHQKKEQPASLETDPPAPSVDLTPDRRLRCLERCLGQLAPESRKLIVEFYEGERHNKIENRSRLAENLAITPNALRKRTQAIRARLEACVSRCVEQGPGN
jgi:DNA-directed RNA polymerase specialized sigma24 family protein